MKFVKFLFLLLIFSLVAFDNIAQNLQDIHDLYQQDNYQEARTKILSLRAGVSKNTAEKEDLSLHDKLMDLAIYYGDYQTKLLLIWNKTKEDLEKNGESSEAVLQDYYLLAKTEIELENIKTAQKIVEKGILNAGRFNKEQPEKRALFHTLKGKLYQLTDNNLDAEHQYLYYEDNVSDSRKLNSLGYAVNMIEEASLYIEKGRYTAAEVLILRAEHILKSFPEEKETIAQLQLLKTETLFALNNIEELLKEIRLHDKFLSENFSDTHPFAVQHKINKIRLDLIRNISIAYDEIPWKRYEQIVQNRISENAFYLNEITKIKAKVLITSDRNKEAREVTAQRLKDFKEAFPALKLTQAEIEFQLAYIDFIEDNIPAAIKRLHHIEQIEIEFLTSLSPLYIETLKLLSLCYWNQENYKKSKRYFDLSLAEMYRDYQRTFSFLSEKEKEYYYEKTKAYFNKFGFFSLEYNNKKSSLKDEFYNLAIKTKGLLFQSTMDMKEKVLNADSTLIHEYETWLFLKEKIAKAEKFHEETLVEYGINIDSIKNKADFLEKDLSLKIELLSSNQNSRDTYKNWYEIKKYLDRNEAAIEVMRIKTYNQDQKKLTEDSIIYAFVIVNGKSQSHPDLITILNGKELETRYFNNYKNSIKLQQEDYYSYNAYWKPVADYLKEEGIDKIYFSPDGIYHQINVNTLLNTKTDHYLLDETTVQYVNNTWEVNKKFLRKNYNKRDIVLFGFPDYRSSKKNKLDKAELNKILASGGKREIRANNHMQRTLGDNISYLPGTKEEVLHIDSLYKANEISSNTFLSEKASEQRLKNLQSPTYLHVATHGFFEENNDRNILLNSGILLAGAQHSFSKETLKSELQSINQDNAYEDGVLTSLEAQNIDLTYTELVVLSACETGVGVVKDGEGVYGLKRSFQTAGAQSVILSLWKVDDAATKEFMNLFYDYLIANESKLEAFQHAQKTLKNKYNHPYFWGAFVLTGI